MSDGDGSLRTCINEQCRARYAPTSNSQVWCHACINSGERDRMLGRRWGKLAAGRICKYCERDDSEAAFKSVDVCGSCYARKRRIGACSKCGRPMHMSKTMAYCEVCDDVVYASPEDYIRVYLLCEGQRKLVCKYPGCKVHDPLVGGRLRTIGTLVSRQPPGTDVTMLVSKSDFAHCVTLRPIAVLGDPGWPKWQETVAAIPSSFVNDLHDLLHFVTLGETNPVFFEWWATKFRGDSGSKANDNRAWDRFKAKLRRYHIPYENVANPDSTSSTAVGLRMDVRALTECVRVATRIADRQAAKRRAAKRCRTDGVGSHRSRKTTRAARRRPSHDPDTRPPSGI